MSEALKCLEENYGKKIEEVEQHISAVSERLKLMEEDSWKKVYRQ